MFLLISSDPAVIEPEAVVSMVKTRKQTQAVILRITKHFTDWLQISLYV